MRGAFLSLFSIFFQIKAMDEKYHTWHKYFVYLPVYLTGGSSRQIEWHLFLNQLEHYLQGSSEPIVGKNYLEVREMDEENNHLVRVIYKRPDSGSKRTLLRYKNNGKIRLLTGIETIDFSKEGGWLTLNVKFRNNESYTGRIWVESWIEEKNE